MTKDELHDGVKAMKRIQKLKEIIDLFLDASADPTCNSNIILDLGSHRSAIHEDDYDNIFDAIFTYYQHQLKQAIQHFKNI